MRLFEKFREVARKSYRVLRPSSVEIPKYEIARMLAKRFEYVNYLEISTLTTGLKYASVDKEQFSYRERFMYRCPAGFSDGEPIDYRAEGEPSEELLSELLNCGLTFDFVFVDSWHGYESSYWDILLGLKLIGENGVVMVHDCNPPTANYAEPDYCPAGWCGVTFAAYLDIVLADKDLFYITVDSDYGCGIISKSQQLKSCFDAYSESDIEVGWRALELSEKYDYLAKHRAKLLHLIPQNKFRRLVSSFGEEIR